MDLGGYTRGRQFSLPIFISPFVEKPRQGVNTCFIHSQCLFDLTQKGIFDTILQTDRKTWSDIFE